MRLRLEVAGIVALVLASCIAMRLLAQPPNAQDEDSTPTEPMCPLSEDQTKNAIAAFAELSPIFREPRCKNCHGAVLPFNNPATHGADPPIEEGTDCDGCHNELKDWSLAPGSMFFVNRTSVFSYTSKSDEELCKQMRDFPNAVGGGSFMGHMKNDNGNTQFIAAAFLGRKGMSDPDSVDPPSNRGWTREKMVSLSQSWVDAMGGRFHGERSCGCKPAHYALRLDYSVLFNLQGLPGLSGEYQQQTVGQNSHSVDIPLEGKSPDYFEGEGVMTLKGSGQVNAPFGTCTGQSQHSFLIRATAQIVEGDEESLGSTNKMHVKLECSDMHTTSSGTCPYGGGSESNVGPCKDPIELDFNPTLLDRPQSKVYPMPLPGSQATLTATLVKRD
jgi:hypothetical protein